MDRSRWWVVCVAMLVLAATAGVGIAGTTGAVAPIQAQSGTPATTAAGALADGDAVIRANQAVRLTPDRPGSVTVELQYQIPDAVISLESRLPEPATVVATNGFERGEDATFEWDGSVQSPSVTYRLPVNRTGTEEQLSARNGGSQSQLSSAGYIFVDVGPWALVPRPSIFTRWQWAGQGDVGIEYDLAVAGEGAAGESMAFLGPQVTRTRTVANQQIRLVIPEAASPTESPEDILNALGGAASQLRVGDRDESVFVIVTPAADIPWGASGLQVGDADMWVRADQRLTTPDNVWFHEYVHSRQSFNTTRETAWITEGSAEYYAAALALEQGLIEFESFRSHLAVGSQSRYASVVLSDPTTWVGAANYRKGGVVAGQLDRRVRLDTDRSRSLQDILRRFNAREDALTKAAFYATVSDVSSDAVRQSITPLVDSTTVPEMWSRSAHHLAFSTEPARFEYVLDDARITGPYRNVTAVPYAVELVPNETLRLTVSITNTGGANGTVDESVTFDGSAVARLEGSVTAGQTTTRTVSVSPARPGRYTLALANQSLDVIVSHPARPQVRNLSANVSTVTVGDPVALTYTVVGNDTLPTVGSVTVARDGTPINTTQITLSPGDARTVRTTVRASDPGRQQFTVGERSVAVDVTTATTHRVTTTQTATTTPAVTTTATSGHGFGVAVALLALVILVGWRRFE
jgi:hypothetical protein